MDAEGMDMERLLVMADDFTGALDTGVQFATYGARTEIITDVKVDFSEYPQAEVLVIDTETRHVSGDEAYETIYQLTQKAVETGIIHLYKKTDSGLRGNISDEVRAVLDASGQDFLAFLPAFPEMNRIVSGGISYVDGIPIEHSVFGRDPFEPVTCSRIRDFFGKYKGMVREYKKPEDLIIKEGEKQIAIFDSASDEDLNKVANYLHRKGKLKVLAGCAGFASAMAGYLQISCAEKKIEKLRKPLLIVCGSINDISKRQVAYAKERGIKGITLTPDQLLEKDYLKTDEGKELLGGIIKICRQKGVCILDTSSDREKVNRYLAQELIPLEEARVYIAARISEILEYLMDKEENSTIMVIGGDTLIHFVRKMKCRQISLLYELEKGVVYSSMRSNGKTLKVISKSGGFGEENLLIRLIDMMEDRGC